MELRLIDRTNRAKGRLSAALEIYKELMLQEAQNPENQILYWIEHSREDLVDEFKFISIHNSNEIVGYLQYSFFREERILFFEYLCVRDRRARGLVPTSAINSIAEYLATNYPPNISLVMEVVHKKDSKGEWKADEKLLTYFKRLGFRELDFDYRYPNPLPSDDEPNFPARLMILLPGGRTEVSSSEMRTMLRCIYFKHYLRWDRPFLDAEKFAERERQMDALYFQEVSQIGQFARFDTNGHAGRAEQSQLAKQQPRLSALLDRIFGPKLPRIVVVAMLLFFVARMLDNAWLLIPFVFAVSAIYCLAEDTDSSRKLLVVLFARLRPSRQRQRRRRLR